MKKILVGALMTLTLGTSALAHGQSGLSGTQGLILGGSLGWIIGRSLPPQQIIIQPREYQIVRIPLEPNMTQPRVYMLGDPPYPNARPVYEERWQFEPSCQCQVKIFNQIGWQ